MKKQLKYKTGYSIRPCSFKNKIRKLLLAANNCNKYDEDFKKSPVSLRQNGKTQTQLCKEYGASQSALGKWVKQCSAVEIDDGEGLAAKRLKELQKRNAQLIDRKIVDFWKIKENKKTGSGFI